MERKSIFVFTIFAIVSLISISIATAQEFELDTDEIIEIIFTFFFGPGFPRRWLTWKGLMQFIVFPFIALTAVCYGIMNELHIFRTEEGKKAQTIIAIIIAFLAGKTVLSMMRGFLIANAYLATTVFGIMLFVGIIMMAVSGIAF